jgi:hypothetical protein
MIDNLAQVYQSTQHNMYDYVNLRREI